MDEMREVTAVELGRVEGGNGLALALTSVALGGAVAYGYRHTIKGYLQRAWDWGKSKWNNLWRPSSNLGLYGYNTRNNYVTWADGTTTWY